MTKLLGVKKSGRLALAIVLTLLIALVKFVVITQPVMAYPANNYPSNWQSDPTWNSNCDPDTWRECIRYCTSWVAFALADSTRNGFDLNAAGMSDPGDAYQWKGVVQAKINGGANYSINTTPAVGAVAWWDAHPWNGLHGHVAWVEKVNSPTSIVVEEYNWNLDGTYAPSPVTITQGGSTPWPDDFLHLKDISSDNTVLQVKKITDSDGTNEVIWSKATDVFDSLWKGNSGISVNNLIHISQGDIKSIDVNLYSNGEHDVFVATAHNIWEIWWYQGQGPHASNILPNIGNLSKVIKAVGPDGTQQLYVLKDTGAYEYWWNSTSGGIQHDTVMTLANPVDEYKEIEADGTQALFVADQSYPYEQRWGSGISGFQQTTFSSVSGITSISFSQDADAKHRYYIGSSSGAVWEASWYTGGGVGYWYMTGGPAVLSLQKWESDSTQVIYEATTGGVFEYSWPITSNTLSGRTIVGGLSSVHSFIRTTDPGSYQSVYTATGTNILESWWLQGSNTITTGQIE